MIREKATELADLPHRFDPSVIRADECRICMSIQVDARHLAWERAQTEKASAVTLPREFG